MPSHRRIKVIFATVLAAVFFILFYTSDSREAHSKYFYARTSAVLDRKMNTVTDAQIKAETDAELLSILAHVDMNPTTMPRIAKTTAATKPSSLWSVAHKADDRKERVLTGEDQSVAGRKTMPKPKEKPKYPIDVADGEERASSAEKVEQAEDPGMAEARAELNLVLKKSPIIIFSKTHCPYSRRAKTLLLDSYSIVPAPYVVELDTFTKPVAMPASSHADNTQRPSLGRKLQDLLAQSTGRNTVPNILVNGKSIGGSDDVVRLDEEGELLDKLRSMGGRWVVEVKKRGGRGQKRVKRRLGM